MKSGSLAAVVAFVVSFLALTIPATASNIMDFRNNGGTPSGTHAGWSLTGALISGSLKNGGALAGGGPLAIHDQGAKGASNGVLLSGAFSGPVTWTLTTLANGTHDYILTGVVTGMMGGINVNAVTVRLIANTGRGYFSGSTLISNGNTSVSSIPEPSTVALFLTGSVSMLGMVRRKLLAP